MKPDQDDIAAWTVKIAQAIWAISGVLAGVRQTRRESLLRDSYVRAHLKPILRAIAEEGNQGWRSPTGAWRGATHRDFASMDEPATFQGHLHRACRIAFAMASGEGMEVTANELDVARAVSIEFDDREDLTSNLKLRPPAPQIHLNPGQSIVAEVAFAWRRSGGNGNPSKRLTKGVVPIRIQAIDASEAHVVARLRKPTDGIMDVRQLDGQFYRPLLAPQSWRNATLGECLPAWREGHAWLDNPANSLNTSHHVLKHSQCFEDLADMTSDLREQHPSDDDRLKKASNLVVQRCQGLIVIDGVVHCPCPEPKLELRVNPSGKHEPIDAWIGWEIGDLESSSPQQSLPTSRAKIDYSTKDVGLPRKSRFPLAMETFAQQVVERWRRIDDLPPVVLTPLVIEAPDLPTEKKIVTLITLLDNTRSDSPPIYYDGIGLEPEVEIAKVIEAARENPERVATEAEAATQKNVKYFGRPEGGPKSKFSFHVAGRLAVALCEAAVKHNWTLDKDVDADLEAIAEGFTP